MTLNENIINQFKLLVKQIKFDIDFASGKQKMVHMYRLGAIQKVLKILENFPDKITSEKQLENIKNVGDKSLLRIKEILETGKLSEIKITDDVDKYLKIVEKLEDVIGIGRKKAYDLFKKYNILSVDDLIEKQKIGEIELPDNIIKGLLYYDKIKEKIPRNDIDELETILIDSTYEISSQLFGIICGSYRRQKDFSNDIDFIICHTDIKTIEEVKKSNYLEKLIILLKKKKLIVDSLTADDVPTKYMGICKLNNVLRRIDIRFMPYNSYYPAILYFTGSKDTNKKMRMMAISMDCTLNEYGLFDKNGKTIIFNSEKEIFEHLNMEYIPPEQR